MRADGATFPINLSVTPIRLPDGLATISFVTDISERKRGEESIRRSLMEKEALLRELYHRTNNNMNVINSLLAMESAGFEDARVLEAFADTENRILSMAFVHQELYESRDLSSISMEAYTKQMLAHLAAHYAACASRVSLVSRIDNIRLLIDFAIPCGLILNELVSNSLKHGYPEGRAGTIAVDFRTTRRRGAHALRDG